MKHLKAPVTFLERIKHDVYLIGFSSSYLSARAKPGQFLHIRILAPQLILRRPFSIHKIKGTTVYILFRVRGRGTALSCYKVGHSLDIIGPLGNGFGLTGKAGNHREIIYLAGGMGVAPLVFLAQKNKVDSQTAILGAPNKNDVTCLEGFKKLGCRVIVATEDGSQGIRGTATTALRTYLAGRKLRQKARVYACGPEAMFAELAGVLNSFPEVDCQVSFEQFMGCGIGVCQACMIKTKQGFKRVCKDGPVFNIKEVF